MLKKMIIKLIHLLHPSIIIYGCTWNTFTYSVTPGTRLATIRAAIAFIHRDEAHQIHRTSRFRPRPPEIVRRNILLGDHSRRFHARL